MPLINKKLKNLVPDVVGDALNLLKRQETQTQNKPELPWAKTTSGNSLTSSKFFIPISIDGKRWDKLYPYRLVVIDVAKGNAIVGGTKNISITTTKGAKSEGIVSFQEMGKQWVFQLPISPQQLTIQDQYAISTSATLKGIVEEHGGVRFKLINASGTMGIWPYRQKVISPAPKPSKTEAAIRSVFGGAIEAASGVANQISRVVSVATSNHPAQKPESKDPSTAEFGYSSTGYYQALALQQFLEQYAEAKKNPENASWRLVFDIPKQNQSFVVTPMIFDWQQNANRPLEIMYRFQLKAWRRIDLKLKASAVDTEIDALTPGLLQKALNTISEARRTISASKNLIGAVRSDVNTVFNVLRQTSLLIKDMTGLATSVAELPSQIVEDFNDAIQDAAIALGLFSEATSSGLKNSLADIEERSKINSGLKSGSIKDWRSNQFGRSDDQSDELDPANSIFKDPESNFELLDQIPLSSLELNTEQQALVDSIIEEAQNISIDDLRQFRSVMQELSLQISNNFGAGDEYYSQIYGKPSPRQRIQPMTLDEYDILKAIYETIQVYDDLTATTRIDDDKKQTNMEYVAGLAELSDIQFQETTSKILAPVPFGLTMEEIAYRYLEDPSRWLEIVTLNNLKEPYIDEDGFQRPLLSNAFGRQITISSDENLYVTQRVVLRSATQTPTARRILDINRLSDTSFLITLDGEADLDNFLLSDSAYLQAYLPGTVNSQQKIFIPSDLPVPEDTDIIIAPSVAADPLVGMSKVDWLIKDSGDLAVNNYGDVRLAAGMTNIIQALKIKIATKKGTVLLHPEFGLGLEPGISNSDLDLSELFNDLDRLISEDPRFEGISSLNIEVDGPKLSIGMGVTIPGQTGVFPVTFELPF